MTTGAISPSCTLTFEAESIVSSGFLKWGSSFRNRPPPHYAKDHVAYKEIQKANEQPNKTLENKVVVARGR